MSNDFFQQHLLRIKSAIDPSSQNQLISDWLCQNTLLKGRPFSFDKFSFQKFILDHPAKIKYTRKSSQCGVSEIAVRYTVGFCNMHSGVNAMYCLPTASFASKFSSTRLSPVIDSSPKVACNVFPGNDSAAVKRFKNDSFIFMQGMSTVKQAISVPCDLIVFDEEDFVEDPEILSAFSSRFTASDHKLEKHFSTPTVAGQGISYGFEKSRRYIPHTHCDHCNHWFIADYYQHVRLPGFSPRRLQDINFFTKDLLAKYDVSQAYLECPNCHRAVDLLRSNNYEFILENPDDNYEAAGFQVTPFIVGAVVPPSELIKISTKYRNPRDFVNYGLGLPAEDATTGLSKKEVLDLFTPNSLLYPEHPPFQVAGTDLGGECAALAGHPASDGHIRINRAELIPLSKMRMRVPEMFGEQRVIASVFDAMPYSDLVAALQDVIPTSWAAVATRSKGTELYQIREKEEDEAKATYGIRQINFKKNQCLDFVVNMIRAGKISFAPATLPMQRTIVKHLTDMKRIKIINRDNEEEYVWRKSAQGSDHFFHALLFLVLANFIKGLAGGWLPVPALIAKFRTKNSI